MAALESIFHFVMIKPTHYDDDGYPIQWVRSAIPSNTLACLNGLAEDCRRREVLGTGVDIRLDTYDETNRRVFPEKIIRQLQAEGGKALIGLVGVQSNQFPRAVDIARKFRAADIPVVIGGFHVSGCLAMLPELPSEIREAMDLGISIFAGEAEENRLDIVFKDAWNGALKPLYNYMDDLPDISNAPSPILPRKHLKHTAGSHSSFDLGRGCPFQCSFCTIINVQGRKSRFRTADDLETIIRENVAQGIDRFFITDDNFARNRHWESFFDRLIALREGEGLDIKFAIQVDTLCHKIENFIEKAVRAGATRVFIGLENINPDNLMAAKKRQNKITEYRKMLQKWREHGATTYAGYILGFPGDTRQSILRDIEIIKRELPLELLEFFNLTPLPGSEDHKNMLAKGEWMDPDLNKYDLDHRVTHHPKMSDGEWDKVYKEAWDSYYSRDHLKTIIRRAAAHRRGRPGNKLFLIVWFYLTVKVEGVHPLEGGFFRVKHRLDRRSGLPIESPFVFYPRFVAETVVKHLRYAVNIASYYRIYREVKRDPDRRLYSDRAIEPDMDETLADLEMIRDTRGGEEWLAQNRRNRELVEKARSTPATAA
ncbi:B12-binding domain-containing radical SAM protein [Afifella pfennigii]|uniref:B12-binding domain-containing radical SAM protein n=1 Tax=Afifella pfennigii TaxID=209897 RepID=UPI00047E2CB6|nr:radical SAM protein [Afifella pfennigii]